jgi:assimilatory nitrate reductase catalytic subunit
MAVSQQLPSSPVFANTVHKATAEKTDARYPLHFNTGLLRDQWHGMSCAPVEWRAFIAT